MTQQAKLLREGLDQLGVAASKTQIDQALQWLALLEQWNQTYNLTAIAPIQRIAQFVWMSVAAIPYLQPARVLDVGSGAGVPGIALAIFAPQLSYTLVDKNVKKARFMRQVVLQLGLDNVVIQHREITASCVTELYDTIIARAFADTQRFFNTTHHCGTQQARWLTFKGATGVKEAEKISHDQIQCSVHTLAVPGLDTKTVLLELQQR